jgi:predicted nucleic acid-binding protein
MILYCDTSALLKHYIEEAETEAVQRLISSSQQILTSLITELELTSALERLKHEKRLDSPTYRATFSALDRDIQNGFISLTQISSEVSKHAKRIIRQRRLRCPDAIQLASALRSEKEYGRIEFAAFDRRLLEAAKFEGLKCAFF